MGEEPASHVTELYNQIMAAQLPKAGIDCVVVSSKAVNSAPVSASTVRERLKAGDFVAVRTMVPPSTFNCLTAEPIIDRIRQTDAVCHDW